MSVVKGIAIILMVLGHAEAPWFITGFIYLFHMPVFFMAAGYFFSERYLSQPWDFVVRRFKGLYLPFIKWSLMFLLLHNLMFAVGVLNEQYGNWTGGVTHPYSWRDMLQRAVHIVFSMGGYDEFLAGAFWFFRALLLSSLTYLVLRLVVRRVWPRAGGPVAASIIICVLALGFAVVKIAWNLKIVTVVQGGIRETWGVFFFSAGVLARYLGQWWRQNEGAMHGLVCRVAVPVAMVTAVALLWAGTAGHWAGMNLSPKLADVVTLPLTGVAGFFVLYRIAGFLVGRVSMAPLASALAYVGASTVYVYVFHIVAFKAVSLLKIWWFALDPAQIGCHMVIHDYAPADGFWVLYTIAGVGLPLLGLAAARQFGRQWPRWAIIPRPEPRS